MLLPTQPTTGFTYKSAWNFVCLLWDKWFISLLTRSTSFSTEHSNSLTSYKTSYRMINVPVVFQLQFRLPTHRSSRPASLDFSYLPAKDAHT